MAVESMSIVYFGQLWVLKLVKYKVVISVCLFLYLIITQEPPNRSNSSNVPQILTEDLGRSTRILLAWFKRSKMVKRKLGLKFFCSYLLTSFWSPPPLKKLFPLAIIRFTEFRDYFLFSIYRQPTRFLSNIKKQSK